MKFPVIDVLHFYEMEQLWITEDMNKTFREGGSIRHASDLFKVPRTCLRRWLIVEGNTTTSKDGQTVFNPGNNNCSAL
jgi:hypothetical protein